MSQSVQGVWQGDEDGGYLRANNPQFLLEITKTTNVNIELKKHSFLPAEKKAVIFVVVNASEHLSSIPSSKSEIAYTSSFFACDCVKGTTKLQAGKYVVVCCSHHSPDLPEKIPSGEFTLTVDNGTLTPLAFGGAKVRKTLAFKGVGCAGYGSVKNPQFFFELKKSSEVTITMEVTVPTPTIAVRYFIREVDCPGRITNFKPKDGEDVYFAESAYVSSTTVSATFDNIGPGFYAVLVMTNDTIPRDVTLTVKADDDPNVTITGEEISEPVALAERTFDDLLDCKTPTKIEGTRLEFTFTETAAREIVDAITAACRADGPGNVWADPDFVPGPACINQGPNGRLAYDKTPWGRPAEISEKPALFAGGVDASDIAQGQIGDCWFCAAIAAIACRPEKAMNLFYPQVYNPAGIYSIRLWDGTEWMAMLIDDSLPVSGGKLVFAHGTNNTEFWFPLIEKAMAKIAGCYQKLVGSNVGGWGTNAVLKLFTGGSVTYLVADPTCDTWYPTLSEYLNKGWICSTASEFGTDAANGTHVRDNGLVAFHAYTPLAVYENKERGLQLISVRNTWGSGEWNGKFSDQDEVWTSDPELAKACGMVNGPQNNGAFWISRQDFEENFQMLHLCGFPESEYEHEVELETTWTSTAAADGHSDNLLEANQILLTANAGSKIHLKMLIEDDESREEIHKFRVYSLPKGTSDPVMNVDLQEEPTYSSPKGSVPSGEVTLPTDKGNQFIVIASRFDGTENMNLDFSIKALYLDGNDVIMKLLEPAPTETLIGTFSEATKWGDNHTPHFLITLPAAAKITINVKYDEDAPVNGIKLALVKGQLQKFPSSDEDSVKVTKYICVNEIDLRCDVEAGTYYLWAIKQQADEGTEFSLTVVSTVPFTISQV